MQSHMLLVEKHNNNSHKVCDQHKNQFAIVHMHDGTDRKHLYEDIGYNQIVNINMFLYHHV